MRKAVEGKNMRNSRTERLGTENIKKLIRDLSIPATTGLMINALYSFIDGIFIGRGVGTNALGGITVAYPVITFLYALMWLITSGTAATFSISLGAGRLEKAKRCIGNSYLLTGVSIGLLIVILLLLRNPVLRLFGASAETAAYALEYLVYLLPWLIFLSYVVLWENLTRAEGNARIGMISMSIGSILNVLLDYIFIFPLEMGVKGAAIATGISQFVSVLYLGSYVVKHSENLLVAKAYWKPDLKIIREIGSLGFSSFTNQMTWTLEMLVLNNSIVYYGGGLGLAVLGILNRIFSLMALPVFGLVQGMSPIMSYNYGAGKYDRTRQAFYQSLKYAFGVLVVGFLMGQFIPEQLIAIFTSDAALIKEGAQVMRITTIVFPTISVVYLGGSAFQAIARPKLAVFFSLVRQIILFIPLVLILPRFFGFYGIWYAYPVTDITGMLLAGFFVTRELRRLGKDPEQEACQSN